MNPSPLLKEEATVKERDQGKYCPVAAIYILDSLLAENDEVAGIWVLLGCALSFTKNHTATKHYFQQALEMLRNVQDDMLEEESCDQTNVIDERIQEIEQRILEVDSEQIMDETLRMPQMNFSSLTCL